MSERCSRTTLDVGAEQDDRDRQGQTQPELVAEHRDGVALVPVVGRVLVATRARHRHPVRGRLRDRCRLVVVVLVIHVSVLVSQRGRDRGFGPPNERRLAEGRPRDRVDERDLDPDAGRTEPAEGVDDRRRDHARLHARSGAREEDAEAIAFVDHLPAGDRQSFEDLAEDVRMDGHATEGQDLLLPALDAGEQPERQAVGAGVARGVPGPTARTGSAAESSRRGP